MLSIIDWLGNEAGTSRNRQKLVELDWRSPDEFLAIWLGCWMAGLNRRKRCRQAILKVKRVGSISLSG